MKAKIKLLWLFPFVPLGLFAQRPSDYFREASFKYEGNRTSPLKTGFYVEKDEYVYIEVHGQIHLGPNTGWSDATGKVALASLLFNRYRDFHHGALICLTSDRVFSCEQLFMSTTNPVYNQMVDKSRMVTSGLVNYVPGVYFLAPASGELQFLLNDTDPLNNRGNLSIWVYTIKKQHHFSRNKFNSCPSRQPNAGSEWYRESPVTSPYYHTFATYRGLGTKLAGRQCAYASGVLVRNTNEEGTFDFGFWLDGGDPESAEGKHLHLVLDMIPHDLFEACFSTERYSISPISN